jgi:hypothetical protein
MLASFHAEATLDLKWYQKSKSPQSGVKDQIEFYINGLRDGIVLLDAYRQRYDGVKEKFCIEGKGLDGARTLAILDVEIADPSTGRPYPEDIPIVFVLIKALERFASCK